MPRAVAPSFAGLPGGPAGSLRADLLAGLTVWAVLVPESLAYATIAGVSPVVGLYAAVPALVLYAVLGSSRHLVVAPMSATAALSIGVVGTVAGPGANAATTAALTAGLALAVGLVALVAGLLRLGFLSAFISEPVLKGFIIGLALTIMIGQVPALLGTSKGSGNFFEKAWHVLTHLGEAHLLTVAIGAGSLAALLLLRRFLPLVPGSLVVALAGIAAVAVLGLDDHGLDVVGTIRSGLPSVGLPDVSYDQAVSLLGGATGVMLVGFAEGLGAAKTYAERAGYDIDANEELLGLGAANVGAGLTSGMVVNGSLSKTAVNGGAGARTQLSNLSVAVLTVVTLLFLTGLFEKLPETTLAAIVIAAVVELVDVASLRRLYRARTSAVASINRLTSRSDFVAAAAALAGVLVFDTLPGLAIGVAISLVLLIARTSRPYVATLTPVGSGPQRVWVDVERNPGHPPLPGVLVVRVEGPLMFANAEFVRSRVRRLAADAEDLRLVVLDGRATPSVDVTAAGMLVQLRTDLARSGVELRLAEDVGQVRDVLRRAEPDKEPALYPDIAAAVAHLPDRPADPDDADG
ncbi:SulP family inorganic anion transporter [Luteipulveratus flavus]|uniref:SulP family inorganic anion transporter n=1 Tax=Luteipulveratus flavus TaxID=3031728 RepID=A0ABT6C208_9MICO|nr:SulP family inorganic anion transporter [Luteipulveratus sp. YIM 133296]MDF8262695.1 SulP family inorganic anion transporter [Luteipulveratus sp. YIM 133296]